jgi:fructoselysine 6-kinase
MAVKTLAVCIGDNCIDRYILPRNGKYAGGNAVNTAVHMQNAGCPTAYIGAVGDDDDGSRLLKKLTERRLDTSHVQVFPGATAFTDVSFSPEGERQFVFESSGPASQFSFSPELFQFIGSHQLVHNTWLGGTETRLKDFKAQPGLKVSMDFGERYSQDFLDMCIPFVDLAFFSMSPGLKEHAPEFGREMVAHGPGHAIVTLGYEGSMVFTRDGSTFFEPSQTVDVVDTLGAGDTYIGTFLAQIVLGKAIPECMKLATTAAARTCTYFGGFEDSGI